MTRMALFNQIVNLRQIKHHVNGALALKSVVAEFYYPLH